MKWWALWLVVIGVLVVWGSLRPSLDRIVLVVIGCILGCAMVLVGLGLALFRAMS